MPAVPEAVRVVEPAGGAAAPTMLGRPRLGDSTLPVRGKLRSELSPFQRTFRHWFSRTVSTLVIKPWFSVKVEGAEHFLKEPALYCFNHLSWMDPLLMLATFPKQPRLYFYGPKEESLL